MAVPYHSIGMIGPMKQGRLFDSLGEHSSAKKHRVSDVQRINNGRINLLIDNGMTENHVMANTFRNTRQCTCIDDVYYNYNKTYGVTSDEKLTTSERSDLCMGIWIQRILAMHTEYKIVQQIQKSTLGGITIHYKQQRDVQIFNTG